MQSGFDRCITLLSNFDTIDRTYPIVSFWGLLGHFDQPRTRFFLSMTLVEGFNDGKMQYASKIIFYINCDAKTDMHKYLPSLYPYLP